MPKLPVFTPKRLSKILEKMGFQLDHATGSYFFYDPKNKRRAVVPFHTNDLPRGTMLSILKQAGITKDELEKHL